MNKSNNNKVASKLFIPLILATVMAIGMIAGYKLNDDKNGSLLSIFPSESNIGKGKVEEVLRFMNSKYLYESDRDELSDEMINQLVEKLDPYSIYIPQANLGKVNDNMNGNYMGIGVEIVFIKDTMMISSVLKDSPAEKAGLLPMDRILEIEGENFTGVKLDFQEFRNHFKEGTSSKSLKIYRWKENREFEVQVIAEKIENSSISYFGRIYDSISYVRIDQFVSTTYRDFMKALEELERENEVKYLCIDLRNNPGGYLTEVTKILSQFFEESERTLVKTVMRSGYEKEFKSTGRQFYQIGQIYVLINGNSASGSEVLAGSLQDWDRGHVIGIESYGKGLVQEQYDLSEGGALRLTVADYFLPSGRSIQHPFPMDTSYFDLFSLPEQDSVYYSLIEKRELYGGKGIIPDIIIENQDFEKYIWPRFFRDDWMDERIIAFIENHPEIVQMDAHSFNSDFDLSAEERDYFAWWKERNIEEEESWFGLLDVLVKAKISYYLFGEKEGYSFVLKKDPYFNSTVSTIGIP